MTQLADVAADLAWVLGSGAIPWLLLVAVVLVRPPAFGALAGLIRAGQASRRRYVSDLKAFRTELAGRTGDRGQEQEAVPLFRAASGEGPR